jgi:nucleoside-diphosphate-sugar epimerase
MKIAVTGANSGVGQVFCAVAASLGHEVVRLVRTPGGSEIQFQLGREFDSSPLAGVDALLHLAWDWSVTGDSYIRVNVEGSRRLLDVCREVGALPILLSTFSAFSKGESQYGVSKRALEYDFAAAGGSSIRSGLIWGASVSGMIATVIKLAALKGACPHLRPDPLVYHSDVGQLVESLIALMRHPKPIEPVSLGAFREPMRLSEIAHAVRGTDRGFHVPVPVALFRAPARVLEARGVRLPFRADSISGGLAAGDLERSSLRHTFLPGFADSSAFVAWMHSTITTGGGQ